ncbi:Ldh family oxidoreductase [Sphingobium terrigena]|uniref:Delta(1)-pyrroline-2-carboxylate/Delta(1)-piperideine-2-carboxylate reductase n=1 Tax=Sphingobium terrigena TaxID=2304063 RepID=A0A418YPG9_9SPHN|nr:Ldh family oxidoreductase [Sphingobium terrigena]RJG53254.1 Ldh family oxidoreductase [Sphingobium terrigena]
MTHMDFDALVALLRRIFLANGTSEAVADILARNCASAERDGAMSHGLFRMAGYVSTLRSGWVDGRAQPQLEDGGASFLRVDAANGFAQPALAIAAPMAIDKARATGACVVAIRRSHHFAALWPDVEPFAQQGLVAIAMVNSMAYVAPPGARHPVYGTNPLAFAAPRADERIVVFDQAVSVLAHGDVQIAARDGHMLPADAGVDAAGQPTRDPQAVLDGGALLPFGGHKGAAIALMIEIMAAALTGGLFSAEVDWSAHPGAQTPCTGECLILIDPSRSGSAVGFADRVEQMVTALQEAGQARMPGDRRFAAREKAMREGIPVSAHMLRQLEALTTA